MAPTSLRAVLADDEDGARRHLRDLLAESQVWAVAECASGDAVEDLVRHVGPDVVCLDVRMPGTDGVEAARAIARSRAAALPPAIVFTTGFPDYATRAFDIGAVDYVLKPLSSSRVRQAMERVRTWLAARHVSPSAVTRAPVRGAAATGTLVDGATAVVRRVFIPAGDHSIAVAPEHIRFIEARGRTSAMHTDLGAYALRVPLGAIERALAPHGFLRTHRAYVVNVRRVRALVPWSRDAHSVLLDGGEETHIPVAKSRLAALRDSVIWIPGAGGHRGSRTEGQSGDRGRRQQGPGSGDRRGAGG